MSNDLIQRKVFKL